ncbi:MAG: hypothetical protein IPL98_06365 [Saprospiraceae bacterium]|nr:hypothetical protein [Saprospiraceae bacterium]
MPTCSTYLDTIFRTWTAVDMFGTSVNCQDTILVRAATIETIVFPPNFDGIDPDGAGPLSANPSPLRCEVPFAVDAAGNPHPSVTGYPSGATCRNINYSYTDIKLRACAQTYKILREWLIIDWCTGRTLDTVQIIKVTDDTPPLLTCYQNITVSTQSNSCTGVVDIPLPPFVSDCSQLQVLLGQYLPSDLHLVVFLLLLSIDHWKMLLVSREMLMVNHIMLPTFQLVVHG